MKIIGVVTLLLGIVAFVILTKSTQKPQTEQVQKPIVNENSNDEIITEKEASISAVIEPTKTIMTTQKPTAGIDKNKKYQAILKTSEGDITIDLFADKTPNTVQNFVKLAQSSYYNNTIFHRVIKGFMIQGGDPKGDGTGGPGYTFDDEPFEGEYSRGTLAMANAGPNTNGSQFFIMHQDYALPKNYVIFGKVSKGIEVVDKIAEAPVIQNRGENSKPVTPVKVNSVEIIEK